MLDKRLLKLKRYIEEDVKNFDELSEILEVSTRQLSRLLKKWADEGYIEYKPGAGRGKQMDITMKLDVDNLLLTQFLQEKGNMTLSEIETYLNLPWHMDSIDMIQKNILDDINKMEPSVYDSVMLDFMFQIPDRLMPNEVNEFFAVHLLTQVCDPLYRVNSSGEIVYDLLSFDEWQGDALHLYLKKNICFSDGTELTSSIVKESLERLSTSGLYTDYFNSISNIEVYDDFHLSLTVDKHRHIIKYLLSQPVTGIYIPVNYNYFIGTGPYRITKKCNDRITLKANLNSFRPLPDIRKVYLLKK